MGILAMRRRVLWVTVLCIRWQDPCEEVQLKTQMRRHRTTPSEVSAWLHGDRWRRLNG